MSVEACRHYQLYEDDFDLACSWGHNAHRFSIEWSRIEPAEGQWNTDAVAHYQAVLRALQQRGLEPVVTLYHFTIPAWFARRGGWLRSDSAKLFARYAAYIARHFGADVRYWLTINEPTVYVMQGYINGEWPPFWRSSWLKAILVCKNLARAHRAVYRVLHQYRQDIMVGFAHSAPLVMPCDPARRRDRMASAIRALALHDAFFYLIGARPQSGRHTGRNLDFIGINYYTRAIIRSTGWGVGALLGRVCRSQHHGDQGPLSDTGWEVYPAGLRLILEKFSTFGLPLLITENGVATEDENLRREFIVRHLRSLAEALAKGVHVIGYLYWTLMDNFEWTMGTKARFGLAAVDFHTQQRSPRPCVEVFERVCRENRLYLDRRNRHP
jgi:beta-glucosidase